MKKQFLGALAASTCLAGALMAMPVLAADPVVAHDQDDIAGVVLFVFGTGAIKGFAIVLSIGILTSMFTALMGSRALLTLMFGGKRKITKLAIG